MAGKNSHNTLPPIQPMKPTSPD